MQKEIILSRISLFVIYAWFGALKLFSVSPANPLVEELLKKCLPFIGFSQFIFLLGLFEIILGILFLIKGMEKLALTGTLLHLATTCIPLLILPQVTWQAFLVPTLEGQYIIKNLLILSLAITVDKNK